MRKIRLGQKFVLVDDEDYQRIVAIKWRAVQVSKKRGWSGWYAMANVNTHTIYMHRFIIRTPKGMVTDHVNGNGLDNRRCNLRICTQSENLARRKMQSNNTSGFRGVEWHKKAKKWQARLQFKKKDFYLGLFKTKKEAILTYKSAAKKIFSEFSPL